MVEVESNDHYNGYYIWETDDSINNQSSIASKYRRMRKSLLDKLDSLEPKVALAVIDAELDVYDDILKSEYPNIHEQLYNHQLFNQDYIKVKIFKEDALLIASYLLFLAQIYKEKELIYNLTKNDSNPQSIGEEIENVKNSNDVEVENQIVETLKKINKLTPPENNCLYAHDLGLLFRIMIDAGYIRFATNETYGYIGHFMISLSLDNIRKAMSVDKKEDLMRYYNAKPSVRNLKKLKLALNKLLRTIDDLIKENK